MNELVEAMSAIPARMNEAWNRGDATSFFADFADDAVFADFEGTIYRGRQEMIAIHQGIFDTVMKGSRLVQGDVLFAKILRPDWGVVHHRVGIMLPSEEEPPQSRRSMQLFVMAWQHNRWEVVALQNSRLLSLEAVAALESMTSAQREPDAETNVHEGRR
ncbi:SgcJ/EcaC family oxidoreductase [Pseudonocardia alaniniphila]|uniref:SgcJ/EcaC family oxidoreductase n=1 Tax=Pseudonocardia alaniniphila TaxID=75291 RepID=A0ABS9TU92_9PSEU|nr:SgcJ/EcaC family oxidoreductase [Pseudonocardia alaniniphila]MCH6171973.1 SgcJ/EcaC family oxidoreductase [Pseudonocardia alaniniphila]